MTVTYRASEIHGLSSDTKPSNVAEGRIFLETDTAKRYIYTSGSWVELSAGGSEFNTFTTAATFTPNKQTEKSLVVVDAENQTQGYMSVFVDGSEVAQVTAGNKNYFIVDPSTSLSIKSQSTELDETGQTQVNSWATPSLYHNGEFANFTSEDGTYYYLGYNNKLVCYTLTTPYAFEGGKTNRGEVQLQYMTYPYAYVFSWNNDGTKIYQSYDGAYTNTTGTSIIYEYTPTSAYDLYGMTTTASASKSLTSIPNNSGRHCFSSDGTKLYTYCNGNTTFYRHDLSTAWDITTASYHSSKSGLTAITGSNNMNIFIDSSGKYLLVTSYYSSQLRANRYTFGTNYDLSTLTYTSNTALGGNWQSSRECKIPTGNQTHIMSSSRYPYRFTWSKSFAGTTQSQVI